MSYLDLAKKVEVRLRSEGEYISSPRPKVCVPSVSDNNPPIRVVDHSGTKPVEIPFTDFCHHTMQDIVGANSDLLIEFKSASGPILAVTGPFALERADSICHERTILFSEIIKLLLPHLDSSIMDKQLIDLLPVPMSKWPMGEIVENAKRILGAEVVS